MAFKMKIGGNGRSVKTDASLDKLTSGRLGDEKKEKLKKFKGTILTTVAKYRVTAGR
jgi:hypothetical protein